ncbi:hypothetical protein L2719_15160 [Shewanella schlegeliana]|uniref:Uncharacterized protein n=1 Tax=Shewanella schlegeliana TaxID=190308 RepID=A0ABS1T1K1_9GAMM|nr:hypothetical protein [Shewanella schlegeliana]MBL4914090.1 hypothetical protein [Shewanella schlegeliana]MCL1110872.1 hypothetical protein [Shewanella schlegeliana]
MLTLTYQKAWGLALLLFISFSMDASAEETPNSDKQQAAAVLYQSV